MAVTKLWKISTNLKRTIDYAENHEKTFVNLKNTLDYAQNKDKTEQSFYITGINCNVSDAYEQMIQTKKCYNKLDGILGYHGYQSFKEGEVTPEEAHNIGIELVNEMWGDKYEVIITTHLNTKCLHNHFVVNSVSFVDGKKFNSCRSSTAKLRQFNDLICKEHGISFLKEGPSPKTKFDFSYYLLERDYHKSQYSIRVKKDVDYAIKKANSYTEFLNVLKRLDYIVIDRYNKLSIRNKNYKRNIRIERRFGDEYSIENIKLRIKEEREDYSKVNDEDERYYLNYHKKQKAKSHSIVALYRYYCFLLKIYPKKYKNYNFTKNMYEDLSKLNVYSKIIEMFDENNITSDDQYIKFVETVTNLYDYAYKNKIQLRKQVNHTMNPKEQERIINKINELNVSINKYKEYMQNFSFISNNEPYIVNKIDEYEKNKIEMDKTLGKQI